MTRYECLKLMAPLMTDHLVVTSQSGQRIEWNHLSDHEGNLLLGMMGCALGVGIGLALALPHRRVVVLESDGSILLSLFNMPPLAQLNPANLAVFVLDNGVYSGSRISEPTATAGRTDLEKVTTGAGIRQAMTIRNTRAFKKEGIAALKKKGLALHRLQGRGESRASTNSASHDRSLRKQIQICQIPRANRRKGHPVFGPGLATQKPSAVEGGRHVAHVQGSQS